MEDPSRARLHELLASQPLAVLATSHDGAPYASLIAIAADGESRLYFATPRATRKWGNLATESRVAVLLDDRSGHPSDFHRAAAATGVGTASECTDTDAETGRKALVERHPHLEAFVSAPSTVIARVDVFRWYVVTRFQSVDCIECSSPDS